MSARGGDLGFGVDAFAVFVLGRSGARTSIGAPRASVRAAARRTAVPRACGVAEDEGVAWWPTDREPVLAQVLRERGEHPNRTVLLGFRGLDRPVGIRSTLNEDRLVANVSEPHSAEFPARRPA